MRRLTIPLLFVVVACATGGALYAGVARAHHPARAVEAAVLPSATPSAAMFGRYFVETANAAAATRHDGSRLARPHCVQASPGHYMCAYVELKASRTTVCHLIQARWTPDAQSAITITLAGTAGRCTSVRDAVRSLG